MVEEGGEVATTAAAAAVGGRGNHGRVFPRRKMQLLVLAPALCVVLIVAGFYSNAHSGEILATVPASLRQCFEEDGVGGVDRWTRAPARAKHSMTEEELFWRATMVPAIRKYPFRRVPKVAFLFLTKGRLPLAPLWERMLKGNEGLYSVYVHSDPSFRPDFDSSSVFYRRFIPSQATEWGRMSISDAERRLLANALLDVSNQRFVLLSESCIPLHNFTFIYARLMGSAHSFVGVFDDPGPHGRGRYSERMAPEVTLSQWRKGSQWFDMDRPLAVVAVSDTRLYPKFARFCRPACYADEHYFPTLLSMEVAPLLANRSLTWVDWSRGGAHPSTFRRQDVSTGLLAGMKRKLCTYYYNGGTSSSSSSCFLFARKFSPATLQPLLLSTEVLGF